MSSLLIIYYKYLVNMQLPGGSIMNVVSMPRPQATPMFSMLLW